MYICTIHFSPIGCSPLTPTICCCSGPLCRNPIWSKSQKVCTAQHCTVSQVLRWENHLPFLALSLSLAQCCPLGSSCGDSAATLQLSLAAERKRCGGGEGGKGEGDEGSEERVEQHVPLASLAPLSLSSGPFFPSECIADVFVLPMREALVDSTGASRSLPSFPPHPRAPISER